MPLAETKACQGAKVRGGSPLAQVTVVFTLVDRAVSRSLRAAMGWQLSDWEAGYGVE